MTARMEREVMLLAELASAEAEVDETAEMHRCALERLEAAQQAAEEAGVELCAR